MRNSIYQWIKQGLVKPEQQQHALQLAGERPTAAAWLSFSRNMLMLLGLLSLAFGVMFFFAYNWNEISRMQKFISLQVVLLGFFVAYYFKSKTFWLSQALLLAAVVVLGAWLALFGQTYQTGADPWQLFATWALLILPLVLFSRSEVLWVVMAVLLNTALVLNLGVNRWLLGVSFSSQNMPWVFLLLNGVLLLWLEWLSGQSKFVLSQLRLKHRWSAQLCGLAVIFILTLIGIEQIAGRNDHHVISSFMLLVLLVITFSYYRFKAKDLLLLTAWTVALMVIVLTFLAHELFFDFDAGGFLLLAICLIGMTTVVVKWIKHTHDQFKVSRTVEQGYE